ncbi:hypothetical protein FACS189493_1690 [Spirochaetia bacterium]|nr:hypothetical protein FACS189493_1690 [Spirochaetia bacterium]
MVDEGLSITLACYNEYMWSSNYPQNAEIQGKDVKEMSLCDNDSLKNVLGDIKRLRLDNRDPPHTNFYYSLLRLSLAELKTGDIKPIIIRGGILNLILFSVSFFVFFLFIKMFFNKNKIIPYIAVFCAFISSGTISNTILLRDYQLQETLFILFSYFFFKFINKQKSILIDKKIFINIGMFSLIAFITSLTLLTGYYALFFIGLFGIYAIYYNKKNSTEVIIYFVIFIFAVIFAQFLYTRYIDGFVSSRAGETMETVFGHGFTENIANSLAAIGSILVKYYFSFPVILTMAAIFLYLIISKSKIEFPVFGLITLIIAALYMLIVTIIAPYKILRYSMAVFPFFVILPLFFINSIKNKSGFAFSVLLLCFCFTVNSFNVKNIDEVNRGKPLLYTFAEKKEVPVIVLNDVGENLWKYADLVPYFNDEQRYIFCSKEDYTITLNKYNDYYFIVEKSLIDSEDMDVSALNESMEKINELGYFVFYRKK